MPENVSLASDETRRAGMRSIILVYTAAAFIAGIMAWFAVPVPDEAGYRNRHPLQGMAIVLRRPVIWAHAAVIVCAYCGYKGLDNYSLYAVQVLGMYCGYKGLDNYSLYAVQVLGMDEVRGAALSTYGGWIRPFAAVAAGLVADRFVAARSIGVAFAVLAMSWALLGLLPADAAALNIVYLNLFVTFFAVFALRGIYFALLEENRTPPYLTGAAVGLVSLVGYTPEVFFAPITGRILDANPGVVGFQHYFLFLAGVAMLGILVVLTLLKLRRRGNLWPSEQYSA
jgi:hypothetical protein